MLGAFSALPAAAAGSVTYTGDKVSAKPGETVTVGFQVSGDSGTAGAQLFFDFGGLQNVDLAESDNPAYDTEMIWNAKNGCVTWSGDRNVKAKDGTYAFMFEVTVPQNGSGQYEIKQNTAELNSVEDRDTNKLSLSLSPIVITVLGGSTDTPPASDSLTWTGDKVTAKAGETVEVGFKVSNDPGTAGAQMFFDFGQLTNVDMVESDNPAYDTELIWNAKNGCITWSGDRNVKAKDGTYIVLFEVKAPTTSGTYYIKQNTAELNSVEDRDTNKIALNFIPAQIIVTDAEASMNLVGDKVNGVAGQTVQFGFSFDKAVPLAGGQIFFDFGSLTDVELVESDNPAFDSEFIWNAKNGCVTWSGDKNKTPADGSYLVEFTAKVPANASGSIEVKLDETQLNSLENRDTVSQPFNLTPAVITIIDQEESGKAAWNIGKATCQGGTEVKVPVTVTQDDGTAAFVASFKIAPELTFKGFEWGKGYSGGEALMNNGKLTVVWDEADGNDTKATSNPVCYLVFTAPDKIGEYKVEFDSLEVTNHSGNALEVTTTNGAVVVNKDAAVTGNAVWKLGAETVSAGGTVKVPVYVTADDGTAGFVASFKHSDALTFEGFEWGKGYSGGEALMNDDKLTVVWDEADGNNAKASPEPILYLTFTAPSVGGEYFVDFDTVEATNESGGEIKVSTTGGSVTVSGGAPTPKIVTAYETIFNPPTRIYYWSHDDRSFEESKGLANMTAQIVLHKFYVNDANKIVDANGNVLGSYTEGQVPDVNFAFETKTKDITPFVKPEFGKNSPKEIWDSETHEVGKYRAEEHQFDVECIYTWDESLGEDFDINDGEPMKFGEFQIFIGLKGDTDLNNRVESNDATKVLQYYVYITVMNKESCPLAPDDELQELSFYLSDVMTPCGMDDSAAQAPDGFKAKHAYYTNLDAEDASKILTYYVYVEVMHKYPAGHEAWTAICGFDFLDEINGNLF